MSAKKHVRSMPVLFTCLMLILANSSLCSGDACSKPTSAEIEILKDYRIDEIRKISKETDLSPAESKLGVNDISITQAYKCGGYILAEHKVSCCFEGYVALYKWHGKRVKQIASFNGYDNKGKYIGFAREDVKKFFEKLKIKDVNALAGCWM